MLLGNQARYASNAAVLQAPRQGAMVWGVIFPKQYCVTVTGANIAALNAGNSAERFTG